MKFKTGVSCNSCQLVQRVVCELRSLRLRTLWNRSGHARAGLSLRHSWGCLAIKIKRMQRHVWTGPAPPYLPPFWRGLNVKQMICMYSLLMFKWTNRVKLCQFLPSPRPFSLKVPSFRASWSTIAISCVRYMSSWSSFIKLSHVFASRRSLMIRWVHADSRCEWGFPH